MMGNAHIVYLGVGSNIDDRLHYLRSAKNFINKNSFIQIRRISKIYETQPYGYTEQGLFLNCVFEIETSWSPEDLLTVLQNIEKKLNRKRLIHWGPRTIDLDILFYDNLVINLKHLTIPHKELHKRLFVLTPLNNLIPDMIHPVLHKKCCILEEELKTKDQLAVIPLSIML